MCLARDRPRPFRPRRAGRGSRNCESFARPRMACRAESSHQRPRRGPTDPAVTLRRWRATIRARGAEWRLRAGRLEERSAVGDGPLNGLVIDPLDDGPAISVDTISLFISRCSQTLASFVYCRGCGARRSSSSNQLSTTRSSRGPCCALEVSERNRRPSGESGILPTRFAPLGEWPRRTDAHDRIRVHIHDHPPSRTDIEECRPSAPQRGAPPSSVETATRGPVPGKPECRHGWRLRRLPRRR